MLPALSFPQVSVHLAGEPVVVGGRNIYTNIERIPGHPGMPLVIHLGDHFAMRLDVKQASRVDGHRGSASDN